MFIEKNILKTQLLILFLCLLSLELMSQPSFDTDSTIISIFKEQDEAKRLDLLIIHAYDIKYKNSNQSIYLFKYAYEIAKKLKLKEREIYCVYHIADTYYIISSFHNAIKYYKIHGKLAEELNDTTQIAGSYYQLAFSYYKLEDYDKSEKSYLKAIKYYNLLNNMVNVGYCYNNLGLLYGRRDFDKALIYYRKAYATNKKDGGIYTCSINMNNIACMLLYKGEAEKAKPILDSALNLALESDNKQALFYIYGSFGEYYQSLKNYKKAENNYLLAWNLQKQFSYINGIQNLLEIIRIFYEEKEDFASAYYYYKIYIRNKDSLQNINDAKTFLQQEHEEAIKQVELKNREQTLIQKEKEGNYQKLIIIISFLLFLAFGFYFIKRKINIKREKHLLDKKELNDNIVIEKIENKNKELVSKTILLGERNNLIKDVSEKLIECRPNLKKANVEIIQGIIDDLNSNLNEKQWEEFHQNFLNMYPSFTEALTKDFTNLSPSEIKMCTFLKLNMSSKEIALINHMTTSSVEVARSRLRKKLGINNISKSFTSFFAQY